LQINPLPEKQPCVFTLASEAPPDHIKFFSVPHQNPPPGANRVLGLACAKPNPVCLSPLFFEVFSPPHKFESPPAEQFSASTSLDTLRQRVQVTFFDRSHPGRLRDPPPRLFGSPFFLINFFCLSVCPAPKLPREVPAFLPPFPHW